MEQHPIPQNISSYEFRLVGDMTLKQFFQLAGGMLVAYLIYRTPLIGIVKYPLMVISTLIGVAMAFIPVNGRPFGRWIVAFIRAIYSPTQFVWSPPVSQPVVISPSKAPLQSANYNLPTISPEQKESKPTPFTPPIPNSSVITNTTTITLPSDPKQSTILPVGAQFVAPPSSPDVGAHLDAPANTLTDEQTIFINIKPKTETENQQIKTEIMQASPNPQSQITNNLAQITSQIAAPTRSNVLTGIAVNKDAKPLDGVIIEIIDASTGIPSRALRTNRTGIFQIITPLTSGTYTILAEKEGLVFDPINIEAKNVIIQPIILTSK